jgi:hypothetical protein
MAAKSGGGITLRHVSEVKAGKTEPRSHAVSPGYVSRLGNMVGVGTPFEPMRQGAGYSTPQGPTDGMGQGPGSNGRQIMKSGSQGRHGPTVSGVARPGADKKIFPGFR